MSERQLIYVLALGFALIAVGFFWLVIRAFAVRFWWGLTVWLPPVTLAFIVRHFSRAAGPLALILLGGAVIGGTLAVDHYYGENRGPRDKLVNGERHLTLNGWNGKDYAILETRRDAVVLQIANPDVTDQTLQYLKGMDQLRELDLNRTAITDEGLGQVAQLPKLRTLRLAQTKITDEGFQKHLAAKESLLELDLTGTDVKGKTKRDWKRGNPDRKYLD